MCSPVFADREQRSKNRLSTKIIAVLPLLLCFFYVVTYRLAMQ